MYTTIAPMMGLPLHRQAKRIRAKESSTHIYMPGLNLQARKRGNLCRLVWMEQE